MKGTVIVSSKIFYLVMVLIYSSICARIPPSIPQCSYSTFALEQLTHSVFWFQSESNQVWAVLFGYSCYRYFLCCFVWMRITKVFNWRHASGAEGAIVLKLKAHGKGLETSGDNSLATALVTEKGSETTGVYELLWVHMKFALFFLKSDIFFDDYCV